MPTTASMRRPRPGSRSISRDASGMPRIEADDLRGSAIAATKPRCALVEVEHLLVVERRERDEADERRGEERQRVPDAPQRADLPQDAERLRERRRDLVGADDRLARRPCLPLLSGRAPARCSCRPRTTKTKRRDRRTRRTATRQPNAVREQARRRAGRRTRRPRWPTRWKPNTSGAHLERVVVGEQRVVRRVTTARPMPDAGRARSRASDTVVARPVRTEKTPTRAAPTTAMRTRQRRSE